MSSKVRKVVLCIASMCAVSAIGIWLYSVFGNAEVDEPDGGGQLN